jgi:hypothetical protein
MNILKTIINAKTQGHDRIRITPCGDGTCIKTYSSTELGELVAGADILSASGSSCIKMGPEAMIDVLNSISHEDICGMNSVGWLINAGSGHITIFENRMAGGRRHQYHDQVARLRAKQTQAA